MNKTILFTLFLFFSALFYGQGKVVVHGEFPDNSLDGFNVQIVKSYTLLQSGVQFVDSVITINGKFHYEGEINEEPGRPQSKNTI